MGVRTFIASALLLGIAFLGGCALLWTPSLDDGVRGRYVSMKTTAYCPCEICCSWKLDAHGKPVVSAGPDKGRPKKVGQTASGTMAHPGTIAADTRYYPMGTLMYVPGYGYGVVEDTGGAIRGRHRLDLFFPTHAEAKRWGKKHQTVVVWPLGTPPVPKDHPPPEP